MGQLSGVIVPVTAFQQNCAILFDAVSKQGVVVDPGGDVPDILVAVEKAGVNVTAIWLTHGHLDHAGGAMRLKAALAEKGTSVQILGPHKDDAFILANIEASAARYGLSGMENCTPDRYLDEGETLSFETHSFSVLHCPGHAPGHVCYINAAARFAHVGDVLFNGSVGRTDLPGGNHAQLIASITEKLLPLGDDFGFICGHGPGSTFGDERRNNPYLR
ncbi:MAG: MBL fold metallo-hydrolase [Rhizobiaceae bacterium]|nr:MBL fold metallo-hydrolase [Rhizobiaceae bacterium]